MSERVENCSQDIVKEAFRPLTLIELLRWRARSQPGQKAYTFLKDGDVEASSLTYEELDRQARAVAALLQDLGAGGERALLLYPPGLEYIAAFFGCLYAGMIAVPAYPPDPSRFSRSLPRLQGMVADAQATIALTTEAILSRVKPMLDQSPLLQSLNWASGDNPESGIEDEWLQISITGDALALLQYTSGSTGTPKGVMLSHSTLLHNANLVYHGGEHTPNDCYVSWLPIFHDMGFMVGILQPLYAGIPVVSMSPVTFLQRPLLWLKAITRYRATTSGGPNFAYDLCVRKIAPEQRGELDLSSWSIAFNGAEPIRHETLDRFTEAFTPCGFRRQAFYPCYGLAEATLIVSGGAKTAPPVVSTFQARELGAHLALETNEEGDHGRVLVGCGKTLLEQKIAIVNPESLTECPPNEVGEIWVSGGSVAQGYWNSEEETARTFRAHLADTGEGPFLRTGDLGFLSGGELYVTGRLKDLIIIRGLNHYPQDIELSVERSHPALLRGCGAAFSVEIEGEERLVVVQEFEYRQRPDIQAVIENIREAVVQQHEIHPYAVVLIKPGRIPKTTSGKIRRRATRQAFLAGNLEVIGEWRDQTANATHGHLEGRIASIEGVEAVAALLASEIAFRLGCDPAGVDLGEPLARYGIDSLRAVELIHLVETRFGVILPVSSLLQSSSIAELSLSIAERRSRIPVAPALLPAPREELLSAHPLSHGQKALWFLHRLTPESPAYNISSAARIQHALDPAALRRAFQIIVERHPSLRTRFTLSDGQPVQEIRASGEISFSEIDAPAMSPEELGERLVVEANRPFDLENGPLLRVNLYRRATDEYVLLLSVHHIAVDLWSLAIIMKELGILYTAERIGVRITLPSPALQYTDYVRRQAEMLASPEGERLRNYWLVELTDALSALDLPADRPRPKIQTYHGGSFSFKLDSNLTSRLKEMGQASGATLYMTLLAAFHVLLHRYTNQERFVVGSPTAGRSRADLAGLIGYVVNLLVLRADLSGNPPFNEYLERVREVVLGAFDHQEYPFPLLVEQLQPEREASRSPIVQVVFAWQKAQAPAGESSESFALGENGARLALGELQLESLALAERGAQFDLTMMMSEEKDGLAGSLQFDSDLFDRETIGRCASHFQTLIEGITRNPQCRVSDLELISEAERRRLLEVWNETEAEYPKERLVHELFEEQVKRTPDALAVAHEEQMLSYEHLNAQANRLAHYFQELGVGPDVRVAICARRGIEMVVGLLGTLKAGGAYVPLDPAYPSERLVYMLQDSGAAALLLDAELSPETRSQLLQALGVEGQIVELRADAERWAWRPEKNLDRRRSGVKPEHLAYVIYTSGSTGQPKGVAIEHRNTVNFICWAREAFTGQLLQRTLFSTSLSFDLAVYEWLAPLSVGSAAHLVGNALEAREAGEVTLINTVPSAIAALLQQPGGAPGSVRTVNLAGEPLKRALVEELFKQTPVQEVCNLYGPSETTTYSTWVRMDREGGFQGHIGRPIANTRIYILDGRGQPAPIGVVGEIYIGGAGVARGYLNRPELTAERFMSDPFHGGRMYRTGDVGRYLPDRNIEFLGRNDQQVKIRGYRIELGEIEAVLEERRLVKQSVVIAREDERGDRQLIGYVVEEGGATPAELKRHLRERLPEYMVPRAIVVLEEMPVTANGKIDRKRLSSLPLPSALNEAGRQAEYEDAGARTPVEEMLVGVFEEVLKIDRVGIYDNFFEIGGHSLLATQVVSRISDVFGVEARVRIIFEEPTAGGLAGKIEAALKSGEKREAPPLVKVPRGGQGGERLPLSFAQRRLWFLAELAPNNPFYNIPGAMRLEGKLELEALEGALNEVVRRHEVLRTRIEAEAGEPAQVIDPWEPRRLERIDLTGLAREEREEEARRIAREEVGTGFDLSRGPLLRVKVLKLEEDEHLLLYTMHHIVSDGWSMGVLIRELGALYRAYTMGEPSPLAELPIQYADFAVWQRGWLKGEALERELKYWREQLADVEPLELPLDFPRPAVASYRGASLYFECPEELTDGLLGLSRREGTTLFMTLLAAFQTLLMRYSGQKKIAVGSPIANRTRAEIEGLIGFFVNTLVLRTEIDGRLSFQELLKRVRGICLGAYAHQNLPFEYLVEQLQPERDLNRQPLFQVMLALQNAPMEDPELPGLQLRSSEVPVETSKFDLWLMVTEVANRLACSVNYDGDLFEATTIEHLIGHLNVVLRSVVAKPGAMISMIEYLTDRERRQLLVEWNATEAGYPRENCIHELFEWQVEKSPDAIALTYEDSQLSYAELNGRANRLAHHLRALGVKPGMRVALLLERSIDLVVAQLAALKSGAAYVPIDPNFPGERQVLIATDCEARVVVTAEKITLPEALDALRIDVDDLSPFTAATGNPNLPSCGEMTAYVMYTSGSSGRPKGVMVSHRAIGRLVLNCGYADFESGDRVAFAANPAFDAATMEVWAPLLNGGRIVVVDQNCLLEPLAFARALERYEVSVLWLTVGLFNQYADPLAEVCGALRYLIVGGDALDPRVIARVLHRSPPRHLINGYGPTETTTFAITHEVGEVPEGAQSIPLGRPISNTQVYILDEEGGAAPIRVRGEIYIGGDGVAHGYLNRAKLTAERFLPDPYSREAGARIYRTGDLGRWLPDGTIEFFGRNDFQVKIRGFRIELGEIEQALMQHPAVSQSVVLLRQDRPSDKRLVAYVARDRKYESLNGTLPDDESSARRISQWQTLFDQTYDSPVPPPDPEFNIEGWNSSYTGQPIAVEEMREWLEDTVNRILSFQPESVLEIGCGTGLILFRVAPYCNRYWATDFSQRALADLDNYLRSKPEISQVSLFHKTAEDFEGIEPESFDTIILNSVVQYFPDIDYLVDVLEKAVSRVRSGGRIIVGDVRSLPLLKAFHASVQFHQAQPTLSAREILARARRSEGEEGELIIDPRFFMAMSRRLPRIKAVDIRLKGGRHHNELTKYRYEAVLRVSDEVLPTVECRWLDWYSHSLKLSAVKDTLSRERPEILGVKRAPNSRLAADNALLEMLTLSGGSDSIGDLRQRLSSVEGTGVEPDDLIQLGRDLHYRVRIGWSGVGGADHFDAIFFREDILSDGATPLAVGPLDGEEVIAGVEWNRYANDPLRTEPSAALKVELRSYIKQKLPEYMMPSVFVVMDEMPLTPNGKLDRRALPAPDGDDYLRRSYEAPVGETEIKIARIWAELLKLERVGRHDNFFNLGGHSLLAVQVLSQLRQTLGIEVSLRDLFAQPMLADFAGAVERSSRTELPPITPIDRDRPLELSFSQQRLWFLAQFEGASEAYHIAGGLQLTGRLDRTALRRALDRIVARHEALRATFSQIDGRPFQIIGPAEKGFHLQEHDLRQSADPSAELRRLAAREATQSFDLEHGPLIRGRLAQMADDEHALLLTMHHIVSDGWSMGVLADELSALYQAYRNGEDDPLPTLSAQYADYAAWQRRYLSGDVLRRQAEYWKNALAGAPALLELPADRVRPAEQDYAGDAVEVELEADLVRDLKAISRRHGATLYMTLLASWAALLARLSGQDDVVIGTPVANRMRAEIKPLIGFFVNTLALRLDLSGSPTVSELLSQVKARTLEAQEHQDIPFEQVVEIAQPLRSLAHAPIFQVIFAWQNAPEGTLDLPGLTLTPLAAPYVTAQFDLSLSLREEDQRIVGDLEYATALFDRRTAQRCLTRWRTLLEAMVAGDAEVVDRLPLLGEAERRQIVEEWNETAIPYGEARPAHEMIAAQADRRPNAVAVVCGEELVSYGELNERANRLARFLRRLGIERESRVGICLERGFGMVESVLGVVKAGGVYVPLDPAYPVERLNFIAKESGCEVVICGASLKSAFERSGYRVIDLEANGEEIRRESAEEFESGVNDANLAYVIYTSGSTGKPKGVMISHGSLSNRVLWEKATQPPDESDAVLQLASFSFDVSVWELFTPLASGARLVLPGPGERQNPERIAHLIEDHKVTIVGFVPSLLELLLEEPVEVRFASLKRVLSGGDALPLRTLRRFIQRCGAELYNFYGPTESTIDATFWRCRLDDGQTAVPIGRPVGNLQAYVLDSRMKPVPIGVPGQLYIGGAGLARGYQERPDLTAEMFAPNPFGQEYGSRLYRTGDLARYREDGNLEHLGRMDQQVKIRGFRIELKEIESALRQYPSVREAVVLAEEQERPALPEDSDDMEFFQFDWLNGEFLHGLAAGRQDIRQLIEKIDSLSEEEVDLALHGTEY